MQRSLLFMQRKTAKPFSKYQMCSRSWVVFFNFQSVDVWRTWLRILCNWVCWKSVWSNRTLLCIFEREQILSAAIFHLVYLPLQIFIYFHYVDKDTTSDKYECIVENMTLINFDFVTHIQNVLYKFSSAFSLFHLAEVEKFFLFYKLWKLNKQNI